MTKTLPALSVLALLGVLALQWMDWPPTLPGPGVNDQSTESAATDTSPDLVPELMAKLEAPDPRGSYASITEHPLFRPDRKPEPPPEEEPIAPDIAQEKQALSAIDLSAVLISPTVISAWVRDPSKPKLERLRIGDNFNGWTVQDILADRVLLERQGEQDALILRDYSQTPPPAASRPPAQRRPMQRQPIPAPPPRK